MISDIRRNLDLVSILNESLLQARSPIPAISPQEARDRKLFGPVYHGTRYIDDIMQNGFSVDHAESARSNGYQFLPYGFTGLPAPIHHLGFGVYFTTVKSIAVQYNGGTTKGLKEFWLDVPRVETINFGAEGTMMKWWVKNGYNPPEDILKTRDYQAWVEATRNLTNTLKSKWDAVWFKGKSMRKLLDGDQIVVFDPTRVYVVDPKLATGLEVGAKVVHSQKFNKWRDRNDMYVDDIDDDQRFVGWKGYFRSVDWDGNEVPRENARPLHRMPPPGMVGTIVAIGEGPIQPDGTHAPRYDVKWSKGGIQHNYSADELEPAPTKRR